MFRITFLKSIKISEVNVATFYVNRSRPVVRVNAEVQLENGDETPENSSGVVIIDSENRTCSLASGIKVACLVVKGCLLYEGEAVDDGNVEFNVPVMGHGALNTRTAGQVRQIR